MTKRRLAPGRMPSEDRLAMIFDVVKHGPADGTNVMEICAKAQLCLSVAGKYLRMLEVQGRIEKSHPTGGQNCRWGLPGVADRWAARRATRADDREAYRQRMADLRAAEADGDKVVQRVVSAAEAEPLRKRGPSSVWELGA